jgi:DNA processing protein
MTRTRSHYWQAALYLPGIGPRRLLQWLEHFGDIEILFQAPKEAWLQAGLTFKQIEALSQPDWQAVETDLRWAEAENHYLVTLEDAAYPSHLKEIPDPPLVLFVKGDLGLLSEPQLAMVGSRHATPAGLQNAEQFAYHLAKAGMVITSGLAMGVDAACHRGALNAKGLTVGVAGTGLNYLYPSANKKLAEEMLAHGGAVISEFPLSTPPHAMNFPRRNRIISGLSVGVLVIEAALKSGSLITARHALEQNREVFAIPGSIHHPLARGCHHLIRQGAKLVETAQDVLEELGMFRSAFPKQSSLEQAVDAKFRPVFDQVGCEISPIDLIDGGRSFLHSLEIRAARLC